MGWACSSPSSGSSARTVWPTCGDGPTSAAARGLGNTTVDNETSNAAGRRPASSLRTSTQLQRLFSADRAQ